MMAFVSLSSGSAIPSLKAAVRVAFRPMTGPLTPALTPRSLSRSTVTTSVLTMVVPIRNRGDEDLNCLPTWDKNRQSTEIFHVSNLALERCLARRYLSGCVNHS